MDVSRKDEIVVTLSVNEARAILADLEEAVVQILLEGKDVRGAPRWLQKDLALFRVGLSQAVGERAT